MILFENKYSGDMHICYYGEDGKLVTEAHRNHVTFPGWYNSYMNACYKTLTGIRTYCLQSGHDILHDDGEE